MANSRQAIRSIISREGWLSLGMIATEADPVRFSQDAESAAIGVSWGECDLQAGS